MKSLSEHLLECPFNEKYHVVMFWVDWLQVGGVRDALHSQGKDYSCAVQYICKYVQLFLSCYNISDSLNHASCLKQPRKVHVADNR